MSRLSLHDSRRCATRHSRDLISFLQKAIKIFYCTPEVQEEMKRLNTCGKNHACDKKKFEFLLKLPPGNGGGCQENQCNSLASQSGFSAACCPFCLP